MTGATDEGAALPTIEFYSDIHCPWAYMALHRLRQVWAEYEGSVRIQFRALSLELKNLRPTPKPVVDAEVAFLHEREHDLPLRPWDAPEWRYVPTFLPAFEAAQAAAQQGDDAVWRFEWAVRHAFFYRNRTVCMRFMLADIAREAELDVDRFLDDWDSGVFRKPVEEESYHGWEELKVPGSPTFVLPSGEHVFNPGAPSVRWGKNHTIVDSTPATEPWQDAYRRMLEGAAAEAVTPVD